MQWIDIVILGIVALSSLISVARGFIKEVLSLVAWVAAFFVAINFYDPLTSLFTFTDEHTVKVVLALFSLFIGTLMVIGFVNYLITIILQKTGLTGTDRLLGMIFGALRGGLIVLVLAAGFQLILKNGLFNSVTNESWYANSILLPEVNKLAVQILMHFNLYN